MTKPKTDKTAATQATSKPAVPKVVAKKAPAATAKTAAKKAPEPAKTESPYIKVLGTAKEIMEKGVWLNGKPVDSVALSVLAKFGTIKEVGKEQRPVGSMGRAGTIYELQGKSGFKLEIKGAPVKAPKTTPAPAPVADPVTQTPTTPLEAMQQAQAEGTAVQITVANPQRLPGGFDHGRAMGLTA